MSANPTLYATSLPSTTPTQTFHTTSLRLTLSRSLTQDLSTYFAERLTLEENYIKSLHKLSSRLHGQTKDTVFKELAGLGIDMRMADQQMGGAWAGVRRTLEGEIAQVAKVHESWKKKVGDEVERSLRDSLGTGEWSRWNATDRELAGTVKEVESVQEKVSKAQSKSTRSSKPSSKLLTLQSSQSTLLSSLTSQLPQFLTLSQSLDLHHSAFLKEALIRCGTATSDLGRERMEMGERLLVQVLGVDESAECEEWALREGQRLGGRAVASSPHLGRSNGSGLASVGESGEPETDSIANGGGGGAGASRRERQDTAASSSQAGGGQHSDAASTRSASIAPSAAASTVNVDRSRTVSRPPPPVAAPLPIPSVDDTRSVKEKSGLGSKLSSFLSSSSSSNNNNGGSSKSRDRSSSIPNSAKYANFASTASDVPPPVPSSSHNPSSSAAPGTRMERRDTGASSLTYGDAGNDLFSNGTGNRNGSAGMGLGGLAAPLQPEPTNKRKSLMPSGAGSLFRRQSKMPSFSSSSEGHGIPASPSLTAGGGGGGGGGGGAVFASQLSAEPVGGGGGAGAVDADGFSIPPEGYDRPIEATAGGNLMDEEDEPISSSTVIPKLSISPLPTLPSFAAPSSPPLLSQESEQSRLAALEAVKNSLGAPPSVAGAGGGGGLNRRGTARGRRSESGGALRNTLYSPSPSSTLLEAPKEERNGLERSDSMVSEDDVPLAVVQQQQQQQHRRAPPPPPATAPALASTPPPALAAVPASPPGSGFSPTTPAFTAVTPSGPAPGKPQSVLSVSSSLLSPSSSSVLGNSQSLNAGQPQRVDPFAAETTPGLRIEVRETVNVLMKAGEVGRVMIVGEVNASYRPRRSGDGDRSSTQPEGEKEEKGGLKIRLKGLERADKIAPNSTYIASTSTSTSTSNSTTLGEYTLLPALSALSGQTVPILKYSLPLPSSTSTSSSILPLTLKPVWRTSPSLARAILSYSLNSSSPLLTSNEGPFGEVELGQLEEVQVQVSVSGGEVVGFQCKPDHKATLSKEGNGVVFDLGTLAPASASASASGSGSGAEGKLLASLTTSGEGVVTPQAVNVGWRVRGRTIGEVEVEVVGRGLGRGEGEGEEEEEVREVRRETVGGKYLCA
ncbi:hypothetical protein JCM11641_001971 [Rhodosporidiobolus odoratus]